ncbi:unnamed protein product [Zymoseptoria tritici ST99CH_1A5]|uniref:Uncharacterized protein n=1 Tax=Zymoseptoria tritici ST99CH_1A5 TaxID=1276529 RepID=A0A1Y6LL61_ZYMTR|nr:unnamed protein product [Zymoseptoria tritici ST99CH_1A5]
MPNWSRVYPSYMDNEPKLLIEWQADPRFSRGNPQSKAAWNDLVPPGHGHIIVHDDEIALYGLGKGTPIPGKGFAYAISGFHQIHCLAMIREALFRLIEKPEVPLYSYGDPSNPALNLTAHLDHCFDYIRQGITCAADATIESKHKKPGQAGPGPEDEGWGNVHVCRSWNSLKEFAGGDGRRPTELSGLSIDHYFQDGSHHVR